MSKEEQEYHYFNPQTGAVHADSERQASTGLHPSTFDYLKPTEEQLRTMTQARMSTAAYAATIDALIPDGPDKTYVLRKIRELGMWINVAITRYADGTPRV